MVQFSIHIAVATKETIFSKRCSSSPLCSPEVESIEHLLFRCDWVLEVVWDGSSEFWFDLVGGSFPIGRVSPVRKLG